jgi:hypothetical protein
MAVKGNCRPGHDLGPHFSAATTTATNSNIAVHEKRSRNENIGVVKNSTYEP